jgi:hypothetical protein
MELLQLLDGRNPNFTDGWYLLGCDAVKSGRSLQMFRGTECLHLLGRRKIQASKPRIENVENVVQTVIETALGHNKFATRDCLLSACLLVVEAVPSSETSVNIYQITRRHIPCDSTLRRCKNICILSKL